MNTYLIAIAHGDPVGYFDATDPEEALYDALYQQSLDCLIGGVNAEPIDREYRQCNVADANVALWEVRDRRDISTFWKWYDVSESIGDPMYFSVDSQDGEQLQPCKIVMCNEQVKRITGATDEKTTAIL